MRRAMGGDDLVGVDLPDASLVRIYTVSLDAW